MRRFLLVLTLSVVPVSLFAQAPVSFAGFEFLLGTWSASTSAQGSAAATVFGNYTFQADLGGTVITRTGTPDSCKGPNSFDCQHRDLLTVYQDVGDPTPHAFYADNEGHVLHYDITFPDAKTVVFLTTSPGPRFRLTYHLEGGVMTGKFQFAPPGSNEFKSYLEWWGTKK